MNNFKALARVLVQSLILSCREDPFANTLALTYSSMV
jgi:hypothetical protein